MWCVTIMADAPSTPLLGCQHLAWDSEFFGFVIARVEPQSMASDATAVERWCRAEGVRCAYLLVDAADQPAITAAQHATFQLVDLRVTLETAISEKAAETAPAPGLRVRPAQPNDLPALRRVARGSHRSTRFYVDGRFDRTRCDDLYDLWITKSCAGWADAVLVAETEGVVAGYVTCHKRSGGGEIGLVGVDPTHRGKGVAGAMTTAALSWLGQQGIVRATVATQGRNQAGLALYQKAGFTVRSVQVSYHKWW